MLEAFGLAEVVALNGLSCTKRTLRVVYSPLGKLMMGMEKGDEARLQIYIYGEPSVPALVLHSTHFNDVAAIQRERTFAGERRF
jgi:hypothetical protein